MDDNNDITQQFFAQYAEALVDRDAERVAELYAVPAMIVFPGNSLAVDDRQQTRDFFASNWAGYDGVTEASPKVTVIAQTGHSVWADVTWSYDGEPRERYVYQLLQDDHMWRIGVLTPLEL